MDLLASVEQQEISTTAAAILSKELPLSRLRDLSNAPSTLVPGAWSRFGELGWFGIGISESLGGVGYGLAEEAFLYREIGRCLAPGPFLGTTLGARAAAEFDRGLASSILRGETAVSLAEPCDPDLSIGDSVTGDVDLLDASGVTHAVVVTPAGSALISIGGLSCHQEPSIDLAVRLSRAHLDQVPVLAYVPGGPGDLFERGSVLGAAILVGISEATRDMAVTHARDRIQFDRPIGVHQAIKHRCADMAVRAEAANCQMLFAALSIDEERPDTAFQSASAKVVATDAAIANAAANVQVHGGMGYTFEHDAHLFVTRAHVLDHVLGQVRDHLHRLSWLAPVR
jgi:alkylation response protein AidB-like acyl-CoA dehydrogenase